MRWINDIHFTCQWVEYYGWLVYIIEICFYVLLPHRKFWTGWRPWLLKVNVSLTAVKIMMKMLRWSVLTYKMTETNSYRSSKQREVSCYRVLSSIRNCRVWEHTIHTNMDPSPTIPPFLNIYTVFIISIINIQYIDISITFKTIKFFAFWYCLCHYLTLTLSLRCVNGVMMVFTCWHLSSLTSVSHRRGRSLLCRSLRATWRQAMSCSNGMCVCSLKSMKVC